MRAPYPISIMHTDNGGFIVTVGCKTLVYEAGSLKQLLEGIEAYFHNPEAQIKAFSELFGWGLDGGEQVPTERGMGCGSPASIGLDTAEPYRGEHRSARERSVG